MNELQKSASVQIELSHFYMLVLYWILCTFVIGGVLLVFLPIAGRSGIKPLDFQGLISLQPCLQKS